MGRHLQRQPARLVLGVACMLVAASAPLGFAAEVPQQQAEERAESIYFEGESAWVAGDAASALRSFSTLVEEFPSTRYPGLIWRAAGRVRAGEIRSRLGEPRAAAARFVEVIESEPPSSWTSRARLGLGITLLWQGDWQAATNLLQSVVSAAESGARDGDPGAAQLASRLLSLSHRLWVRPAIGERPWQRAGALVVGTRLDNPIGVAADDLGTVLITDEGLKASVLVDLQGNAATTAMRDVRRPWWSASGIGFIAAKESVAAPQRGESYRFMRPDGARQREVRDVRAGASDAVGGWVLLDNDSKQVMMFTSSGEYVRSLDLGANGEPIDVARGPRGELYVIERRSRLVRAFGADGTMEGGFGHGGWERPYALDVDAVGHVYVLDRDTKRVDVFDVNGMPLWSLGPTLPGGIRLEDPRDVAVDGAGRVFIADRGLSALIVVE